MASSRLIQHDLFEDDFVGSLTFFERLLWIGLFGAVADDQGRFMDSTALIRAKVFLYDANVTDDKAEKVLVKLTKAGKIVRYSADEKRLCQIVNWWKHQRPSWASASKYPAPEGWQDRIKAHVKGKNDKGGRNISIVGWDRPGGYAILDSALGSPLDSEIKEDKEKEEVKDKEKKKRKKPEILGIQSAILSDRPVTQKDIDADGVTPEEEFIRRAESAIGSNIQRSNQNQIHARKMVTFEKKGQSLEKWITWCISDEWRAAHMYMYANLAKMWTEWPQAFDGSQPVRGGNSKKDRDRYVTGDYADYIES